MQIKLTASEIAENHGVTERTAYRWLSDGDPRCFTEVYEEPPEVRDRREGDMILRKNLDDLAQVSNRLSTWKMLYDDSPRLPKIAGLLKQLYTTMDKLQEMSGLYPEINWNETCSEEDGEEESEAAP